MKLGKDEIQKLFLGGLLLIGVIYSYFTMLLFPLQAKQAAIRKSTEALTPEIAKAKAQIKRTTELERTAPELIAVLAQAEAMIPEGSPVAWFPTKVADFFRQQGIEKASTRFSSETAEKELPGFRRLAWGIDLPKVDFAQFGSAICALENEEPLLQIASLQIDASRDDVQAQHALINVQNIVKQ
ncbi:MAG TPA: hypothetical protein VGO90_06340 [Chthoniobacteraceae bacterium]|jgi:hypothetical protein|nr:hypothetical protein [Chthoniobacteraceae bacterium]